MAALFQGILQAASHLPPRTTGLAVRAEWFGWSVKNEVQSGRLPAGQRERRKTGCPTWAGRDTLTGVRPGRWRCRPERKEGADDARLASHAAFPYRWPEEHRLCPILPTAAASGALTTKSPYLPSLPGTSVHCPPKTPRTP